MERNTSTGQDGICPHCHARVEHLAFAEDRTVTGEFRDGIHYEMDSWPIGEEAMTYECPKCGHVLFHDEREASAFLGRQSHPRRNDRTRATGQAVAASATENQKIVLE